MASAERPGWYGRKAPPADRLALIRLAAGRASGGLTDRPSPGVVPTVRRSPALEALLALAAVAGLGGLALWLASLL